MKAHHCLFHLLLSFPFLLACRDAGLTEALPDHPVDTLPVTDTLLPGDTILPVTLTLPDSSWVSIDSLQAQLPHWAAVYVRPDQGAGYTAWTVVFDPQAADADWHVQTSPVLKPLGQFWSDEPGDKLACINATFFGSPNRNFGLVIRDNHLVSPNVQQVTRTFQGVPTSYFPTRAAVGMDADGQLAAGWTYTIPGTDSTFLYPSPAPNQEGSPPLQQPDAGFPAAGILWDVRQAVGGSPMLLRNGEVNITADAELVTGSAVPSASRPRSAIGFTAQGTIILLAVQAPDDKGIPLPALAELLRSMGATDAMNLDGGGSTGLFVAGNRLVSSSDGTDRPIVSAIFLKRKQ
ncbi:MAG: hypothetical protein RLY31_2139 [Bacteroidota bacterium]|jgi:hypothetical protein